MHKIAIVTFPLSKSGITPLSNLIRIVEHFSDELYLLTGGETYKKFIQDKEIYTKELKHKSQSNILMRIIEYIKVQFEILYLLIKLRKDFDYVIFFIGAEGLILPALIVKLLKKKLIVVSVGFPTKISQIKKDPLFKITDLLSKSVFNLSNKLVVYSKQIIEERKLQRYKKKLFVAREHCIDINKFKIDIPFYQRKNIIGYVGTLNELKGVKNLIQAIPDLLNINHELEFVFIGDGPLIDELKLFINEHKLEEKVIIKGWIQHEDLPIHLNKFKLLVLPSYTEGLPNVIIEAMACGTPILTTSVGAIPDIVKDNVNGFIMKNNTPTCIIKNVIRANDCNHIDKIIKNANLLISEEFTFENVCKNWKNIIG